MNGTFKLMIGQNNYSSIIWKSFTYTCLLMSESTRYLALKSNPAFMHGSALKFVGRSGGHMNLQVIGMYSIPDTPTLDASSLSFKFFFLIHSNFVISN